MLDEYVEIVGLGRLQIRIAKGYALWTGVRIDDRRRYQVTNVRTRNSHAVIPSNRGVFLDEVLNLYAWQGLKVAGRLAKRRDERIPLRINLCRIHVVGSEIRIRPFESYACLHAEFSQRDSVH